MSPATNNTSTYFTDVRYGLFFYQVRNNYIRKMHVFKTFEKQINIFRSNFKLNEYNNKTNESSRTYFFFNC